MRATVEIGLHDVRLNEAYLHLPDQRRKGSLRVAGVAEELALTDEAA